MMRLIMSSQPIVISVKPLGFVWHTFDPFLFCVHHNDAYPAGNERMGPNGSLAGRNIGMDFEGIDGWRMYHGDVVPGFPRHPHRGFETITLARRGYIDHSDSLGATARFGHGDAQWMTAGSGIVHCEMFPLVSRDSPNPVELFQIWINLPRVDKMVKPHFSMLWAETIPRHVFRDGSGRVIEIVTVAGAMDDLEVPTPPPNSWAARPESNVAIWTIRMEPGARWTLPAGPVDVHRALYLFAGDGLRLADQEMSRTHGAEVRSDVDIPLVNGPRESELVMLQGRPIREPVVQHGPFVMNESHEIRQAMLDYQRTEFGGWPWAGDGPVHARDETRFAIHADSRMERPE